MVLSRPMSSHGVVATRVGLVALALAVTGCRSCKDDHPYVPYSIDEASTSQLPPSGVAPGAAAPEEDAGPFHAHEAIAAPKDATAWTLDGLALAAPADWVFTLGLTGDFDGDGAVEASSML